MKVDVGKLVLLIAIFIGVYTFLKQHRDVFFNVPKVGFIFHMMLGGAVPPFMDHHANAMCLEPEKCPWLTSGDVFVDVCSKCGTNWMMTVVHELRTWKVPEVRDFNCTNDIGPWTEFANFPGFPMEERHLYWGNRWNSTKYPFKQYKSHVTPYLVNSHGYRELTLPVRSRRDVRFLVVVRNPYDELLSAKEFFEKLSPFFAAQFGGFPVPKTSIENFVWALSNLNNGGESFAPLFFKYWYEYRNDENVLLLHYTDIFRNQRKYIRKIADFLQLDLPDKAIDDVVERTSMDFVKKRGDKYSYMGGRNLDFPTTESGGAYVNKGGVGRSKSSLTKEQRELMRKYVDQVLPDPHMRNLLDNGFEASP